MGWGGVVVIVPPIRRFKLNVDGSWNAHGNVSGFGMILRGDVGNFIAEKCGWFEHIFSPLLANTMAIREGLVWAITRDF